MSKKATKMFTLWFLFVLCFVPALFLTPPAIRDLTPPQYTEIYAQVVSVEDGRVSLRHDGMVQAFELGDSGVPEDWKPGATVPAYVSEYGTLHLSPERRSLPSYPSTYICLALLLASAALFAAARLNSVKRKPRPAKEPAPSRPSFDPERKK